MHVPQITLALISLAMQKDAASWPLVLELVSLALTEPGADEPTDKSERAWEKLVLLIEPSSERGRSF